MLDSIYSKTKQGRPTDTKREGKSLWEPGFFAQNL